MTATTILQHPEGTVEVSEHPALQTRTVFVRPGHASTHIAIRRVETSYPVSLIETMLQVRGLELCDDIARDEDPCYVQAKLRQDLSAYFPDGEFEGKRILDFGCGGGSSTMILARMLPASEIVGVELSERCVSLARARLRHYGFSNVTFEQSPSGESLPASLGSFDVVILSAVFEHLLPAERPTIMPQLWRQLIPGGCLLINQTPHRYYPIEIHTTGLPLVNYLPETAAMWVARRFSKRKLENCSREVLLRKGIRGATEKEILRCLGAEDALLLEPSQHGLTSRVDLWYSTLSARWRPLKKVAREVLRLILRMTGTLLVPQVSVVIRKRRLPQV